MSVILLRCNDTQRTRCLAVIIFAMWARYVPLIIAGQLFFGFSLFSHTKVVSIAKWYF